MQLRIIMMTAADFERLTKLWSQQAETVLLQDLTLIWPIELHDDYSPLPSAFKNLASLLHLKQVHLLISEYREDDRMASMRQDQEVAHSYLHLIPKLKFLEHIDINDARHRITPALCKCWTAPGVLTQLRTLALSGCLDIRNHAEGTSMPNDTLFTQADGLQLFLQLPMLHTMTLRGGWKEIDGPRRHLLNRVRAANDAGRSPALELNLQDSIFQRFSVFSLFQES